MKPNLEFSVKVEGPACPHDNELISDLRFNTCRRATGDCRGVIRALPDLEEIERRKEEIRRKRAWDDRY